MQNKVHKETLFPLRERGSIISRTCVAYIIPVGAERARCVAGPRLFNADGLIGLRSALLVKPQYGRAPEGSSQPAKPRDGGG